jgi:hypothetical protein
MRKNHSSPSESPKPPKARTGYTLGGMVAKPAESLGPGDEPRPPSEHGSPAAQNRPGEDRPGERIGPVAIARHVKDDGRALILYSRERQPPT